MAGEGSAQEIILVAGIEVILGADAAAQRLTVAELLQIIQATGDAPAAAGIKGEEVMLARP
jgi:hypothetical protein